MARTERSAKKQSGVRILLTPGTRVPPRLRRMCRVHVAAVVFEGTMLRVLDVEDANAYFHYGEDRGVYIETPRGNGTSRLMFGPCEVIQIRNLRDNRFKDQNLELCPTCFHPVVVTTFGVVFRPRGDRDRVELQCAGAGGHTHVVEVPRWSFANWWPTRNRRIER